MFLHEWTQFPEDSYWTKDQLGERIKGILERIQSSVARKDIRSFWVPGYKLFVSEQEKQRTRRVVWITLPVS